MSNGFTSITRALPPRDFGVKRRDDVLHTDDALASGQRASDHARVHGYARDTIPLSAPIPSHGFQATEGLKGDGRRPLQKAPTIEIDQAAAQRHAWTLSCMARTVLTSSPSSMPVLDIAQQLREVVDFLIDASIGVKP